MRDAVQVTPLSLAKRFLGLKEISGSVHNPAVVAMLQLDAKWAQDDETPWCSAFVNYIAWLLRVQRSRSLAARSWLQVGTPVALAEARPGFHVCVFQRGDGRQPGPEVISAPGHVAFFDSYDGDRVIVVGGNQGNAVSLVAYPRARLLGIREI